MDEKKLILKMIEEGKITAEEGMILLETIEKGKKAEEQSGTGHQGTQQRQKTEYVSAEQFQRVKEELQEATERIITSANKGATKLFEVLGKTIQKVQDIDFDFDFSLQGGVKVVEKMEVNPFSIQQLHISSSNGNVRCTSWWKEHAEITVTGFISKVKDEREAKEKLLEAIIQKQEGDHFSFSVADKKGIRGTIEVKIPSRLYEQLHLTTNHGSVQMMDLQAQELVVTTSNGSIRMEKVNTDRLQAETSNGRIQVHQVEAENVELKSSNGSIHSTGHIAYLQSETTNGSIRIKQEKVDESQIKAITNNGSIKVMFPPHIQGVYGELRTNFGSVKCLLPQAQINEESSQVSNKMLSFQQSEKKTHSIIAESKTGSVQVFEQEGDSQE